MDGGECKSSSSVELATACGSESAGRSNSETLSRYDKPNYPESRSPCGVSQSPPACLQWAQSLHFLLQDPDGVKLFREYLESEGQQHADALHFWFACEGLKNEMEREKIQRLIKVIYNTFLIKSALPIHPDLLRQIALNLKSTKCITFLEEAQAQIENLINNSTYPNFLKSDMYLQYLQSVQNPCSTSSGECSSDSSSSGSSVSGKELIPSASGLGSLPTLHEDVEFTYNPRVPHSHTPGSISTGYLTPTISGQVVRLTKDVLLLSQTHRAFEVRPKMEAYAGVFSNRGMGAHAAYNSYNPVSRQDSELQSLSSHSDARTESDLSTDGRSASRNSRCRQVMEAKRTRDYATLNRETNLHQTLIPRTQLMDTKKQLPVMDLKQHAAILSKKLEDLKREQDRSELLDKKLKESELPSFVENKGRISEIQARELAIAIKKNLQLEDERDEDILDRHLSRVFSPTGQSPGCISPRQHSPTRSNRYSHSSYMRSRRREGDGSSMLSGDSGNIYDFSEGSDYKLSMVKSKSMPEYADDRFNRGCGSWRSTSKPKIHRTSATSPNSNRHKKGYSSSRSSSLERDSACGSLGPTQPFIADPSLPPPPRPNPDFQLEEARKRLMEDDFRFKPRQRLVNKYHQEMSLSSQSTLRKSTRGQRPPYGQPPQPEESTTVIFSFCDEQFPYRSKIPGSQITLRQFKEYLPKKGNYRFFFKTVSEELDNQVIQEEVSNDFDIIPLWEGKIMAQVKPLD